MTQPAPLQVTDLSKEYPTPAAPLVVLRSVTFRLDPGQSLAIQGPSGSGKSTLLNILGALDRPTAGSVRLGDVDPFALSPNDLARFRGRRVGFVFQDHHLLPQCTALENVLIPLLAQGRASTADQHRAADLLTRVGLAGRAQHLPAHLSGGERQRVAVARALIRQPDLVLCDEPTGNLDSQSAQTIADLLLNLTVQSRVILIAVTHSPELAQRFPQQMHMHDGSLLPQREIRN